MRLRLAWLTGPAKGRLRRGKQPERRTCFVAARTERRRSATRLDSHRAWRHLVSARS